MQQISFDIFENEVLLMDTDMKNLQPEEMTFAMFMSNPDWVAVLDEKASGDQKGQYHMIQPDGKRYSSGWIGKFKNPDAAKRDFHYKQIYWAVFRGREVSELVLSESPVLLQCQRRINALIKNIDFGYSPYIAVTVNEQVRHFDYMDCPLFSRVNMREFIKDHALIDLQPGQHPYRTENDIFGPVEEMAIAIERKLHFFRLSKHRPHLFLPDALQWGHPGIHVGLRLPEAINEDLDCTQYRDVEGITVNSVGSCMPRVECQIDGEIVKLGLYPSILTKYRTNQDVEWIAYNFENAMGEWYRSNR